ncbi:MAG TPA: MFS transporter [Anaeromyxobacteraceae bacterium]|nr:MFS transporter [Anaeromyxobacteraceae bacterium]
MDRPAQDAAAPLRRLVDLRAGEGTAALGGFAYFFSLLAGYYLLRPIREEMGIRGGVETLHWSFTATFVAMMAAIPAYSALVARVPRTRAVPIVYRFFLLNLLVFFLLFRMEVAPAWVARAFFVWLSVYNLFVVSVFWSLMADVFTSEQARRLFGFVAAGGTAGAIAGPVLALALVGTLGIPGLVLLSAAFLEVAARSARRLARRAPARGAPGLAGVRAPGEGAPPVGGTLLSGIGAVFRSPYLAAVAAHVLLFTLASTFLYLTQARIVADGLGDPTRRTQLFAGVDLAVSVAQLAAQTLLTGRVLAGFGLGAGLSLVPVLSGAGFALLAAFPSLWAVGAFQTLRRAAHFAVERPAREVLYTVVSREERYKSKAFIDTVVYRGGDALGAWVQAGLAGAGLGVAALSASALPLAAASLGLAIWLARRERRLEAGEPKTEEP